MIRIDKPGVRSSEALEANVYGCVRAVIFVFSEYAGLLIRPSKVAAVPFVIFEFQPGLYCCPLCQPAAYVSTYPSVTIWTHNVP